MSEASGETREDRLRRVRREIEAGTYDTPERLEAAVEAFLASPDAEPSHSAPCGSPPTPHIALRRRGR